MTAAVIMRISEANSGMIWKIKNTLKLFEREVEVIPKLDRYGA